MTPPTPLPHVRHLVCLICGRRYGWGEVDYVCPAHGDEGILDVVYDLGTIRRRWDQQVLALRAWDQWRYRELLPIPPRASYPPLRTGGTPLYRAPRLAADLGLRQVWVKDETVEPTGSLKDRASAVAVVAARDRDAQVVATASTGNAAAALAGLAASSGTRAVVFVPADAPAAKLAQLLAYGATVLAVEGTYDQAYELCLAATRAFGWYCRNTAYNPLMTEGKKTAALEIAEQLDWEVPDVVVVSVGDGCTIGGLHKGFTDLQALGWTDRVPRLLGVQAAGSAFLAQAWEGGEDVLTKAPITPDTVADSIRAALPRDRLKALRAVRASAGAFVTVPDRAILAAIGELAQATGVFTEPAAAAAWAGLRHAVACGLVGPEDRAVVVATGSGLKDITAATSGARRSGRQPAYVSPDLDAVERALAEEVTS